MVGALGPYEMVDGWAPRGGISIVVRRTGYIRPGITRDDRRSSRFRPDQFWWRSGGARRREPGDWSGNVLRQRPARAWRRSRVGWHAVSGTAGRYDWPPALRWQRDLGFGSRRCAPRRHAVLRDRRIRSGSRR